MNTQAPKEWKSYQEQLEILQSRGMIIDDKAAAEHCLRRVGYYRLSGYWYPFRQYDDKNKIALNDYREGTKFSTIEALYNFDRHLRLLALDAIERIELAVQVDVANILGKRDPYAHENPQELHGHFSRKHGNGKSNHDKWLEDCSDLVNRSKRKTFVAHHLNKYGRLPVWVAIEIFDFGTLSKLYAGMKQQDKLSIEKQFGLNDGRHFETWLRGFNFIRNTSAHHSRLWNCNILELASVPMDKIQLRQLKNARPFFYFCLMQSVLSVISPSSNWKERFIDLLDSFPQPENNAISIADMGVVSGWKEWNIWK